MSSVDPIGIVPKCNSQMRVADRDPNHDTNRKKNDIKIFSYNVQYRLASKPPYPASYLIMLHVGSHERESGGDATRRPTHPISSTYLKYSNTILAFATQK
jgi:hypothetical protein